MTAFFITATGTEIGKTLVTCALTWHLRQRGEKVTVLKPIVTGYDAETAKESDTHLILEALGKPITQAAIDAVSPWRFTTPLAPDAAAEREGREIDFDALVDCCRKVINTYAGTTLIEGVGGAFVPLAKNNTVADWIAALDIPSILVAGNYLGSQCHTISTLEAMHARDINVAKLIISDAGESAIPPEETLEALAPFLDDIPATIIPRLTSSQQLWQEVDIGILVGLDC